MLIVASQEKVDMIRGLRKKDVDKLIVKAVIPASLPTANGNIPSLAE